MVHDANMSNMHKKPSMALRFRRVLGRHWELYLLFLPVAVWYFIFHYIPMGGIVIAFKDYFLLDGILASPWVGMKHFIRLFSSALRLCRSLFRWKSWK